MRRHVPTMPAQELGDLLALIARELDARIESLGPRPKAWRALTDTFALGRSLDEATEARAGMLEIHRLLFASPGRRAETTRAWIDAQATAAAARTLAKSADGSPATAALAAIVSHGAEALVLRAIGAVESGRGLRLDPASVASVIGSLAPVASSGISRQWKLAAAVVAAARDVRGVPEQRAPSTEAKAVYFARLLASTVSGRGFAASGLEHALRREFGIAPQDLDAARTASAAAERAAQGLAQELPPSTAFEAAG
jgi:hypothetical protein